MPQPKTHASNANRQAAYRSRCKRARQIEKAAKGLPALPAIPTMPGWPRWNASLNAASELLSCIISEMQEYFNDRSETWQESGRGAGHQEKIDAFQTVLDSLDELTMF